MAAPCANSTPDPYHTNALASEPSLALLEGPDSPAHREHSLLLMVRTYSEQIECTNGRTLELMKEDETLTELRKLHAKGAEYAVIAQILLSMMTCNNSQANAIMEAAKHIQTCNQRLRQLELWNARHESYICSMSLDIKWPFTCDETIKNDCIENVMKRAYLPLYHITAVHHTTPRHATPTRPRRA